MFAKLLGELRWWELRISDVEKDMGHSSRVVFVLAFAVGLGLALPGVLIAFMLGLFGLV